MLQQARERGDVFGQVEAEAAAKDSKGTSVPVYRDKAELNEILDRLQNK